jgi:hypothetical protein
MNWVTRQRLKTDRIACPWLVRRFIDPHAEIAYVPADQVLAVAARDGAHSFDAPGAEFTHRYDQCTFEVLIDAFNLAGDLALVRLARIVHAADIAADLASDPLGPGLLAIGEGDLDVEADDQRLLDRGRFVYDAGMPVEGSPQDGGPGMRRRPADTEAKMSHRADANRGEWTTSPPSPGRAATWSRASARHAGLTACRATSRCNAVATVRVPPGTRTGRPLDDYRRRPDPAAHHRAG